MADLDKNSEVFVMNVAVLKALKLALVFFLTILLAAILLDKAFIKIFLK